MPEELRKRPVSRRRAVAASAPVAASDGGAPVPSSVGSTCGHGACEGSSTCNVRYVGAVSHIRDHHAMHAARGVGHIWAASVITGFAVVLTGVIAYQSAQAKTVQENVAVRQTTQTELRQVMDRLTRMERLIEETRRSCVGDEVPADTRPEPEAERQMLQKKLPTAPVRGGTEDSAN